MTDKTLLDISRETITRPLLDWYEAGKRDLPWRTNPTPYRTWLSEILLQQTQMDRGVDRFNLFVKRFPEVRDLARASEEEVLRLWEGLGYYNRARNLHAAARLVANEMDGRFPETLEGLSRLPGVGAYTAGAIASIAFGKTVPAVDANVDRVMSRVLDMGASPRSKEGRDRILGTLGQLIPEDSPGDFNQALMELGAMVCKPRKPECDKCPVATVCRSRHMGTILDRTIAAAKPEIIHIDMATGVLLRNGCIYLQKRRPGDVWPGLWEFPGGVIEQGESPVETLRREYREETELDVLVLDPITTIRYSYTRYRVTMHCFYCQDAGPPEEPKLHAAVKGLFASPEQLDSFAFPSGHRKLVQAIIQDIRLAPLLRDSDTKAAR